MFPPVGVDQLLGLLKVLRSLAGRADMMQVGEAVDADLDVLSHAVDAAEMLGLVRAGGGDVELTEEGLRAAEGPVREFQLYLKRRLASIRPFRDLLAFLRERGRVAAEEAVEFLSSLGYDREGAGHVLRWAVFGQLVEMDDGELVASGEGD